MVPRILLIVLAGGKGSRLDVLTVGRAKPSLPVGGTARLIDVTMSNAANSGLRDVWVVQQYEPHLLNDHLAGGRPWDLDRNQGGLRILPPYEGAEGEGFASGNADALARQARVIAAFEPEVVLGTLDDLRRSDEQLGDYADGLVPALIDTGRAYAFAHEGYWRDLGTPEAYLDSQLELLRPRSPLRLDDSRWPIISPAVTRVPARVEAFGPGTVVEREAEVRHCVLMADVKVGAGASVARAVVADGAWIGAGARLAHLDPVDDTPLLG